ncbi:hypothetical protein FXO38_25398 [Capsicum annuum]|nr:hypothetical protein FXO38_25398 [Capsicum annuum]KAF3671464.1 hypothetical protein FXO37_08030 [Capsicum annuum]
MGVRSFMVRFARHGQRLGLGCEKLGKKFEKIYNVDEGVIKIQEVIQCRRILLVLDDVDDRDQIHESIGCLEGLVYLNMRDCKNLKKLPGSFCLLKSLEKLIISGCSKLVTTVIDLGKLESLTTLQDDGMNFGQLVAVGENNKLTFLCRWKFGKYLQNGDQINVSLLCWSKTFKMKEFGVTLTYDNLEPDQSSASTSEARVLATQHTPIHDYQFEEGVMEGFLPLYQLVVHHFYLSHPDYYVFHDDTNFVVRSILKEKLFKDCYVHTVGSGVGVEKEDDNDSIFDFDDDDEDEEATLAEIEELF